MGSIQTETPYYQPDPAPPTPFTVDAAFKDPQSSEKSAWGLWVEKSQSIFVLGAGHYSVRKNALLQRLFWLTLARLQFFQNYKQDCLKANTCQNQIVNIDDVSTIALYQLATVGVVNSLSVNQKRASSRSSCSCHMLIAFRSAAVISASKNVDGIQDTVTAWTRS
jgi:glucan 1,3-beta-glucosidase